MTRPSSAKARFSHTGLCVRDLDRVQRFYETAFGFTRGRELTIVNAQHALLGLSGDYRLRSVFLRLDSLVLELLGFDSTDASGEVRPRPMNREGFTHLSFNVDALDVALADVERAGGRILAETHTIFDLEGAKGEIVFVTDPEGNRIELMAFPEDVVNA